MRRAVASRRVGRAGPTRRPATGDANKAATVKRRIEADILSRGLGSFFFPLLSKLEDGLVCSKIKMMVVCCSQPRWLVLVLIGLSRGCGALAVAKGGSTRKMLQRPSGMLTVAVEYQPPAAAAAALATGESKPHDVSMLSMRLRKMGAAAIFTPQLPALHAFVTEQQGAKGDFPGPCAVVFSGTAVETREAIAAGASAVVLGSGGVGLVEDLGVEVIWRVTRLEEIHEIDRAGYGAAVFLIEAPSGASDGGTSDGGTSDGGTSDGGTADGGISDAETCDELIAALPEGAYAIGSVNAMQAENAELAQGRQLTSAEGKVCADLFHFNPQLDPS